MRYLKVTLWFAVTLIVFSSVVFVKAQQNGNVSQLNDGCVNCVPAPPGFICRAGPSGGEACSTDGGNCTISVPCPSLTCQGTLLLEKTRLQIDNETIKAVSKENPRFAYLLISLRKLPPINLNQGKMYSAPVSLEQADIEWQLMPAEKSKEYNLKFKQRIKEAFESGLSAGVFEFSVTKVDGSDNYILTLQVSEPIATDPKNSTFKLNLSIISSDAEKDVRVLQGTTWQIN